MRALRLLSWKSEPVLEEVPEPIAGPGQVVVRIGGAGVCHSDLHLMHDFEAGALPWGPPFTLGHENAGWVHQLGDGVDRGPGRPAGGGVRPVGLRAVRALSARHRDLLRGPPPRPVPGGGGGLGADGGMAELMLVPDARLLVPLPDGLDPVDAAPLTDAGLTPYHAVRRSWPKLAPAGNGGGDRGRWARAPRRPDPAGHDRCPDHRRRPAPRGPRPGDRRGRGPGAHVGAGHRGRDQGGDPGPRRGRGAGLRRGRRHHRHGRRGGASPGRRDRGRDRRGDLPVQLLLAPLRGQPPDDVLGHRPGAGRGAGPRAPAGCCARRSRPTHSTTACGPTATSRPALSRAGRSSSPRHGHSASTGG